MTSDAPPSEEIVIVEYRDRRSVPDENLKRNPDTIAEQEDIKIGMKVTWQIWRKYK